MFVQCEFCKGKGTFLWNVVQCSACEGKGGFEVPEGKRLCPGCRGRGKNFIQVSPTNWSTCECERCKGEGFVDGKV